MTERDTTSDAITKPNEVVISYSPLADTERWLRDRVAAESSLKTTFTMVAIAICIIGLLAVGTIFANAIWSALGEQATSAAEYAARKAANEAILGWFSLAAVMLLGTAGLFLLRQPTHIKITSRGLNLLSRRAGVAFPAKTVEWKKVQLIELHRQMDAASHVENYLHLNVGKRDAVKIKISAIGSSKERLELKEAIERNALSSVSDHAALDALGAPREQAYTELWLQALTAPSTRSNVEPLIPGAVVADRFKVKNKLGVGGQGTAYLAEELQAGGGKPVVLKEFILPVYVNINVRKQSLKAFENEARILQSLNHPGIVQLIEFFAEDQRGYLVLEFIDGIPLEQKVLQDGPLGETDVRALAKQMCEMLIHLHSMTPPVVHRDFTPDNLILRNDGTLKLVDFNVATHVDAGSATSVVGKHAYLPPEQFRGQPIPASDIYAMGGTLFFLLTGRAPEPICANHPKNIRPEISEEMNLIVATATAIDPAHRFKSAQELAQKLN
jgi:tRNA A-37 threonylcarbamoyl transferase component Bud32